MSTTNITTNMSDQLALWLEENRALLIQRWQDQAPELQRSGPMDRLFTLLYDGIIAAARKQYDQLDRLLARSLPDGTSDNRGFEFPELIQLPFRLRRIMAELLRDQSVDSDEAMALLLEADPILERAVLTLSRTYSTVTTSELQQKINETEILASRQALLAEEADRAALKISTLYEISRALSSSLDLQQLLMILGDRLRQALDLDDCAIWLINRSDSMLLECRQAWGEQWAPLCEAWLRTHQWPSMLREALAKNQPLQEVVKSKTDHGLWSNPGSSIMYIPLKASEIPLGCLVVQHPDPDHFGLEELRLAEAIGHQASVALENAYLYSEIRAINTDLEQKVAERAQQLQQERDRLQILFEIGHYITGTLDIDDLLQRTLQALAKLMGNAYGSVMLLEHDTGHLVQQAVLNELDDETSFVRFQMGEGIAGWIAQNREPVLLAEVRDDPRWVAAPMFSSNIRKVTGSLIGVPLIANDEIVGVLMLSHPVSDYFNEDHLLLMKAIAGEIAIAIYNAQLYSYLNERAERFGSMLRRYEEEASKMNAILQSLADGVIVCSNDGVLLLANLAAQRLLERPLDELLNINTTLNSLLKGLKLPPGIGNPVAYVIEQPTREDGKLNTLTATLARGHRTFSVHLGPVLTERGETLGAVAIIRDITREVESDRIKTEFIATVSHELRTPMTSIKGYTQLLPMLGEITESQREFLTTISANADRMIAIINDLLDITKVETGSVDLEIHPLRFAEVLGEAISECKETLTKRAHNLSLELGTNLPLVLADHTRLRQILFNLISNACKYTPNGGQIVVRARQATYDELPPRVTEDLPRSNQWVLISVQDNGVGIDPSEHEKIFERFYRTENPLKVEAGGTGLGLSLVRGLVSLHGGRIWVESAVGRGSTFHMIFPAAG
ncbi:MAG: histidine kinase [Herpetosiphonaceae bacterium]|nr:MAG: histidine kinase [Herpetosiphonaceae bacterium]